jgi:BASS family bile acid:Na+ symporter
LYPPTSELLQTIDFNAWSFLLQTSLILVAPLLLGVTINTYFPKVALRIQKPLVVISTAVLLAIIVMGAYKYWATFVVIGSAVMGLVVLHNALAFFMGNMSARLFRLTTADQRALTFEVGIQNSGLGIVILLTQLGGLGGAAVVAGIWGVWHIVAGLALVVTFVLSDRRNSK